MQPGSAPVGAREVAPTAACFSCIMNREEILLLPLSRMQKLGISAFLAIGVAAGLLAQSSLSQQISGQVADRTGAVVPGVSVTVSNQDTGLTRAVTANPAGNDVAPRGRIPATARSRNM
jgi:hypothetical protein